MAPGTYEGHRDIPYGGSNTIIKDQLNTVTLTVRADGTADLSDSGIPIQGHIDYGSDSATFIPQTTVMGRPVDPETEKNFTVPLKPSGTSDWLYGNLLLKKR
jgi:hypothetical protein